MTFIQINLYFKTQYNVIVLYAHTLGIYINIMHRKCVNLSIQIMIKVNYPISN